MKSQEPNRSLRIYYSHLQKKSFQFNFKTCGLWGSLACYFICNSLERKNNQASTSSAANLTFLSWWNKNEETIASAGINSWETWFCSNWLFCETRFRAGKISVRGVRIKGHLWMLKIKLQKKKSIYEECWFQVPFKYFITFFFKKNKHLVLGGIELFEWLILPCYYETHHT